MDGTGDGHEVTFAVLGPVVVWCDGVPHGVRRGQARAVLALLVLDAGRWVSADAMIEALWGGHPPATARAQVQAAVAAVRRMLAGLGADGALGSGRFGYRLGVDPDRTDVGRFDRYVRQARELAAQGRHAAAARQVHAALGLWRGDALADASGRYVEQARSRLAGARLAARELRAECELAAGRPAAVVGDLTGLVTDHPLHESLRAKLALALYRTGRHTEALRVVRDYRRVLARREGLVPGPELGELEVAMLRRDPRLHAGTAPDRAPALLPLPVSGFIGRTAYLDRLDRLLPAPDTAAVVVVCGLPGAGKTALAVHWAHRVRARFPGGQLHLDLQGYSPGRRPVDPADAVTRFLQALGVPPAALPDRPGAAADLYRTLLADRQVLVLLDNARDADQVRPLLPSGAGSLAVVTSRDALSPLVAREGATRLRLGALPDGEGLELLTARLGADRVAADAAACAELVAECGGLPLALSIAVAGVTDGDGTVRGYLARLRGGDRLTALAVPGDPGTAVREAFGTSYDTLGAAERAAFRRPALLPGATVTADVASLLTGLPPERAEAALRGLVQAHLVQEVTPGRFGHHDLLRAYAAERVAAEDDPAEQDRLRRAVIEHYLTLANEAARLLYPQAPRIPANTAGGGDVLAGRDAAAAWLEHEWSTLEGLVHAEPAGPAVARLADALRGALAGHVPAARCAAIARIARTAARAGGDRAAEASALLALADAELRQGRAAAAATAAVEAGDLARAAGWRAGEAAARMVRAREATLAGRLDDAGRHHRAALPLLDGPDDAAARAAVHGSLAVVCWLRGDLDDAVCHQRQAVAVLRAAGSVAGEAAALADLAEDQRWLGTTDEAMSSVRRSLALHREAGDRGGAGVALCRLAALLHDTGQHRRARDTADEALSIAEDLGNRWLIAEACLAGGAARAALGEPQAASDRYHRALEVATAIGTAGQQIGALCGLADQLRAQGRPHLAAAPARRAVDLAAARGYRAYEGVARTVAAAVHLDLGQVDEAVRTAIQAIELHHASRHRPGITRASAVLARAQYLRAG